MLGLMQDWPLLCHRIIDHAAIQHGNREVVTRSIEGPIHRTNYREVRKRALKVAQRLEKEGIKLGDRVATLAWNTWRHLETWYGITGIGAVYHTINPRLFPEQIVYIANHAEDRMMFLDLTFVPLMAIMFALLALLEDSGYMARAALVTDRVMRRIGLPGKAFLPLVVGFGCNVPAISATRILPDARHRIMTALLVPFTSCSARLTVYGTIIQEAGEDPQLAGVGLRS